MAKNKTVANAPVESPANGSEPAQAESLGVADLQNCAQVIDVAVSRGAFRANDCLLYTSPSPRD